MNGLKCTEEYLRLRLIKHHMTQGITQHEANLLGEAAHCKIVVHEPGQYLMDRLNDRLAIEGTNNRMDVKA